MRGAMRLPCTAAACLAASVSCRAEPSGPVKADGSTELSVPFEGGGSLKVSFVSDGTVLRVAETYPTDVQPRLDPKSCRGLLTLYVDADNNAASGGAWREGHGGYEYEVTLWGCGPQHELFKPPSPAPTGFYSMFATKRYTSSGDATEPVHDVFWESPVVPWEDRTVTVSVPYAEMALKARQVVRISSAEFPDVLLTLK